MPLKLVCARDEGSETVSFLTRALSCIATGQISGLKARQPVSAMDFCESEVEKKKQV